MNCPKCGSEIIPGYQFCMNCGASLVGEAEEETKQESPESTPETGTESTPEQKTDAGEEPTPRRRRAAQAAAAGEEAQAPAEEPEQPVPAPAPVQDTRPPRQKPARPVPPPEPARAYKRSSGKGVWFWLGILLLVLIAAYVAACIVIPDHALTAPAVNLAQTVWNYFSACGKYLLWFPIALGAIILLSVLKVTVGRPLRRKLHAADLAEARELASRVVVAETLAHAHQLHAEIAEVLETRKLRKKYFPRGKFEFGEFSNNGVPLDYSCGKDQFTANFVFQRLDRAGTRIYLEIIRWQVNNDIVSKRCLSAMRGLEPMLRDTVRDVDAGAAFQVYDR